MKEILPVPVAEAKRYFDSISKDGKYLEIFREAYENFYCFCGSKNPEELESTADLVESCLRLLPKRSEQAKGIAIKVYQLKSTYADLMNNLAREELTKTPDSNKKEKITKEILEREWEKEATRQILMMDYEVQIPGYATEFPEV